MNTIRLRIGRFGLGDRGMGLGNRGVGLSREACVALREDHRMRADEIGWERFRYIINSRIIALNGTTHSA
jgi:hypothetical protein